MQGRETVVTTGSRPAPSEAVREAVTMALYVGVVLAAEFVAVEEYAVDELSTVAVIWGSALGVALAHVFAFNLAARLFAGGRIAPSTRRAVWAQLATAAAFVVIVPFFFLSLGPALDAPGFLLAALIGVTAFIASPAAGREPAPVGGRRAHRPCGRHGGRVGEGRPVCLMTRRCPAAIT